MSDTCPGILDRAEAGDGQAMLELAEEHRRAAECDGKLESWPDAHRWYRRAINAGVASAACELGICLLEARGVPMDVDLGFTWVRRAATDFPTAGRSDKDRGHEMARLGECYFRGEGVGRDAATAVGWLTRAAELGHEGALLSLAACYARGTGVKADIEQARAWAERAAVTCIDGAARDFPSCRRWTLSSQCDPAGSRWMHRRPALTPQPLRVRLDEGKQSSSPSSF